MQLDRLSVTLQGGKTHFAKFVELKQENAILQVT